MKIKIITTLTILLVFTTVKSQQNRIFGKWANEDSTQVVQFYKEGDHYNAKLIYFDDENADILLDTENEDENLKKRRVLNATVWTGFEYQADKDMWKYGEIYNYKNGNTYTGKIRIEGDELRLTGYYGFFFFLAKTQKWYKQH